jgi:hypothetical protein
MEGGKAFRVNFHFIVRGAKGAETTQIGKTERPDRDDDERANAAKNDGFDGAGQLRQQTGFQTPDFV